MSIAQLIAILQGREGDPDTVSWITALQGLLYGQVDPRYERYDLVCYICGQWPVRRQNWLPTTHPHSEYTGNRPFEAVEVHLRDVDGFVGMIYGQRGLPHGRTA